jgi:hypothetical protein
MELMQKIIIGSAVAALSLGSIEAMAAANIKFDSLTFDAGTIHEGSVNSIKHDFIFKNTGTDTLRIEKVKPG